MITSQILAGDMVYGIIDNLTPYSICIAAVQFDLRESVYLMDRNKFDV
ncbi:MAG: hypothetical protein WAM14_23725 [Candidatus Nitrosopolaris sp.]